MGKHTLEKKTNKISIIAVILIILAVIIGIVVYAIVLLILRPTILSKIKMIKK